MSSEEAMLACFCEVVEESSFESLGVEALELGKEAETKSSLVWEVETADEEAEFAGGGGGVELDVVVDEEEGIEADAAVAAVAVEEEEFKSGEDCEIEEKDGSASAYLMLWMNSSIK